MIQKEHKRVSIEDTPLKEVWEAIKAIAPRIKSTDELLEGQENLYYKKTRALLDLKPMFDLCLEKILKKQDPITSTDDIPEGGKNRYFTYERVRLAIKKDLEDLAYTVTQMIQKKQDQIVSTDEIAEGNNNLYFSAEKVNEIILPLKVRYDQSIDHAIGVYEKFVDDLQMKLRGIEDRIDNVLIRLSDLENPSGIPEENPEIAALELDFQLFKLEMKKQFDASLSHPGANKRIQIVTDVIDGHAVKVDLEIRGGTITRVLEK